MPIFNNLFCLEIIFIKNYFQIILNILFLEKPEEKNITPASIIYGRILSYTNEYTKEEKLDEIKYILNIAKTIQELIAILWFAKDINCKNIAHEIKRKAEKMNCDPKSKEIFLYYYKAWK